MSTSRRLVLLVLFTLLAAMVFALSEPDTNPFPPNITAQSYLYGENCPSDSLPVVKAPKFNVWTTLSQDDNIAVWNLLHSASAGLNLTDPGNATITDNYVFWIDALPANKSDVVPYLYGSASMPKKFARAVIFEGAKPIPVSQEYMIGPLPVGPDTMVLPLDYIYNGGSGGAVPFNARVADGPRMAALEPLIISTMSEVADITAYLFHGAVYYGAADERTNISPVTTTPMSLDGTQAYCTMNFLLPGDAPYLMPIDLFLIFDFTGTDPAKYFLKYLLANGMSFSNTKDFREAYNAGRIKPGIERSSDTSWVLANRHASLLERPLERKPAPQSMEIGGKRYSVDLAQVSIAHFKNRVVHVLIALYQQYVEYMGWSFYIAFSNTLGIMLFDIRFKGIRIMYELSLQEALAQYSGSQPKSAGTVYHDTHYSLGAAMGTLLEGFDCPFGSTFLNTTFHVQNRTVVNQDAICLFESDLGFPISRHRSAGGANSYNLLDLGVAKGASLTVRAIATVANYDYLFDYTFQLDGSLEVKVRTSGNIQSTPYSGNQSLWGPRVQQAIQGSLHDHIITFKADLDIVDSTNSFEATHVKRVATAQPWFPELGEFEQMQLQKEIIQKETRLDWPHNGESMYSVIHGTKNKWGESRGYRIIPGHSNVHLEALNSPFSFRNSEMSKMHLAVTRQHDNEPFANSFQNVNLPQKPQQDFGKFFDNESTSEEDLVVWFNLGMHHFTRSEDVPLVSMSAAYSSITFAPHNFFDEGQDTDLLNRRWIRANTNGTLQFDDYGIHLPACQVTLQEPVEKIQPRLLL